MASMQRRRRSRSGGSRGLARISCASLARPVTRRGTGRSGVKASRGRGRRIAPTFGKRQPAAAAQLRAPISTGPLALSRRSEERRRPGGGRRKAGPWERRDPRRIRRRTAACSMSAMRCRRPHAVRGRTSSNSACSCAMRLNCTSSVRWHSSTLSRKASNSLRVI